MAVSKFLVKGVNTIQYRMVRAADAGVSVTAYADIWFAKLDGREGTALQLSGTYGEVKIQGKDGEKSYAIELTAP